MPPADLYEGATEPIWFGDRKVYSVTGFTHGVRSLLVDLQPLWVEGEISGFRYQAKYSMIYFTLKDPRNGVQVNCTMPRARYDALRLRMQDGDLVQLLGRGDIYLDKGTFQLRVQSIEHAGRGLIMQQLEALASQLAGEGLFDASRKRQLPFMPRIVGVITGADAAAQGDFIRIVTEQFPPVELVIVETLVQGERAAPQIVVALRMLQRMEGVDVIVVTRGGGAFEDFLPFSDERVCREIAACTVPVISAIGHEKDSPISDNVADVRMPTPTAAARAVVPNHADLAAALASKRQTMHRRVRDRFERRQREHAIIRQRLDARSPEHLLTQRRQWVTSLQSRVRSRALGVFTERQHAVSGAKQGLGNMSVRVARTRESLTRDRRDLERIVIMRVEAATTRASIALGKLRALSPLSTLARGYAIVRRGGERSAVHASTELSTGEVVTIMFGEGTAAATITDLRHTTSGAPTP